MWLIIAGALLLGGILALFYLKDHFRNPWLAEMAYHELTMRLVVVACALMALGVIFLFTDWIGGAPPAGTVPPKAQ